MPNLKQPHLRLHTRLPLPRPAAPVLQPLALAAALALGSVPAWGLPEGATLRFGQAQVLPGSGPRLDIRQDTARAGLDWTSFSIAAGERVVISQPGRDAVLVNRVIGNDPSRLFGQLQSNGTVWLVNPRGIVFGRDSQVDVGGLLASTLSIRSDDMASGRLLLSRLPGDGLGGGGAIQADGRISAPDGSVVLVAPSLSQGGHIDARRIGLVAATQVEVDVEGDGLIFFNARNDGSLAARLAQLGTLRADGGTAELRAAGRAGFADTVLNLDGVVQARSIGRREGRIVIDGGDSGITWVAGTLDASGRAEGERGGQVTVLGEKIGLAGSALLDASGAAGGGGLRVGGDLQGGNADIYRPAQQLLVQAGARLDASALQRGDGGLLVLWSQGATRFAGAADARGGALGGDGGLVEVSGKGLLDFAGQSDRSAPNGRGGTLLLDPLNLLIALDAPNLNGTAGTDLASQTLLFSAQAGLNSRITAQAVQDLLATGAVTLEAVQDITVSKGFTVPSGNVQTNALTLRAGNNVIVSDAISNKGDIVLSASTPGFSFTAPGPGGATTTSTLTGRVQLSADLTSTGGAVRLTNNVDTVASTGVHQLGGTITTGTLAITGAVEIPTALTLALGGNGSTTLGNALSGAGSLTKAGATSTLVLTNITNSHGSTAVSGGTLQAAADAALGAGGLTLSAGGIFNPTASFDTARALVLGTGGGTVQVGGALQLGLTGLVSGSALTKTGTGALVLDRAAGANTYAGGTTVSGGTLRLARSGAAGDGTVALGANTLDITGGAQIANLVTVANGATISSSIGGGTLTAAQPLALAAGPSTLTLSGTAGGALVVARNLTGDASAGQAVVVNGGVVTLSGSNAQDATTVTAGTLRLAASGAAGPGTSTVTLNDNVLDITDNAQIANLVTVADGARITSSVGGGTLTNAQTLALAAGPSTLTLSGTAGGALVVARDLVGDLSAGQAVVVNGGVVTLSGSNGQDSTAVSAGTLRLGASGAAGGGLIDLGANTLDITGGAQIANLLTVADGATISSSAGGGTLTNALQLTLAPAPVAGSTTLKLSGGVTDALVVARTLVGDGGDPQRVEVTSGRVTLSGANGQDATVVSGGTLSVAADTALGATAAGLTLSGGGILNPTTSFDTARAVVLGTGGGTVEVGAALQLGLTGPVSGSGLTKTGTGILVLADPANTHSSTTVSGGTLQVAADAPLGAGSLTLSANAIFNPTASFDTSRALVLGTGGGTVQVGGALQLGLTGLVSGSALTKTGTGTLLLDRAAGANTYTGGTTVSGGTLRLARSGAAGDGTVALGANTLDITGGAQIANLVTVADGATISSSTGGGTLTAAQPLALAVGASTLTLSGTSTSVLTVARNLTGDASADQVVEVTGGRVTLSGSGNSQDGTTVTAGTLRLAATGADGSGPITLGANTLDITDGAQIASLVTVADGASITSTVNGGTLTDAQTLTLASGSSTLNLSAADGQPALVVARRLLQAAVSTPGLNQGVRVGGGVVTLSGANTYEGDTTVAGGTLRLAANAAAGTGDVQLGANTLDITNGAVITNRLTVEDNAQIRSSSGGGTLAAGQALVLAGTNSTLKLSGGASDALLVARELRGNGNAGQAVEVNGGVVALSGSNSHDALTVSAGTLRLANAAAAGATTVTIALGANTLDLTGATVLDNPVTVAAGAHITSSSGGGTLSAVQTLALPAGPGTLRLSSGGDASPLVVARQLVGDASLAQGVEVTAGKVSLGGSNSQDSTTVSGGTLTVAADAALGSGSLTLSGGAVFQPTASFDMTRAVVLGTGGGSLAVDGALQLGLGGLVSGSALTKTGTGTLVLARAGGANTYTGGTTVSGGVLRVGSNGAAGDGTITLGANTLDITGGAVLANALTVADGARIVSSAGGGTLSSAQGLTLATGPSTLQLAGAADGALVIGSNLLGGASAGQQVEVSSGVVVLSGNNAQDGTTVTAGTLRLAASTAAGSGAIGLGANTLDITGGVVITNALTVADGARIGSSSGGGTLSATTAPTLTLATGPSTLRLSSGSDAAPLVISRSLVGAGSGDQVVDVTGGLVTLSGSNSQGGSTVSGGTLRLAADGAAGAGAISVGANTLDIVNNTAVARDVRLAGGSLVNSSGSGRLDGALTLDGGGTVASTGSGLTLAGVVGDVASSALTVGGGRVTLLNDNTYRGGTTVSSGTLVIDGSLQAGLTVVDAGNGTIALGANTLDIVNGATVGNRVTVASGALISSSSGGGTLSNAQTLALAAGASTLRLAGGSSQPLVVARDLLDHAAGLQTVAVTGGLVTLSGSNTHDGGTSVSGGATLAVATAAPLGSGGLTLDAGRLRGTGSFDFGRAVSLGAGGGTVEVDNAQTLGLGGTLSGAALTKAGGGTLVLTADNSFAGGTTVSAGILAISGTGADAGSGQITLGGRTLDITDGATPGNAVSVDGGTLTNSSGTGRLNGTLTLVGDATLSSTATGLTLAGAVGESSVARAVTITGGRVTLAADNSWRGGTTVSGGTLAISGATSDAGSGLVTLGGNTLDLVAGAAPANAVTVNGGSITSSAGSGRLNGTLTLLGDAALSSSGGSSGLTLGGVIGSNNVARSLTTSGTVVLLADNSYLGTTTVQGGTLALSGAGADAGGSTLQLNAGTLDIRNGATPANAVVANGGAIGNSTGSGQLGGSLTLATASTMLSSAGDGLTLAGVVGESGGARAINLATGHLTLTRDNSYTGGTTLAGGTLTIDGPSADAGSGTIALGANVLDIVNGASVGNAVTVADGARIRSSLGGGTLAARPGDATALTLASGNSTLTLSATDSNALVIARPLLDHASGAQRLQVQGGVVELTAAGSYDGGTTVSAGTLRLAAGAAAGSGAITLGANRLDIVDGASVANALTVADGATVTNSRAGGTLAFNATPVALAADTTLALSSSATGLVVDRAITAAPADAASARLLVSRSGNGSGVTLQRANTHGGGTTVDAGGRLAIGNPAALGSGALTLAGGTLASTAAFDTTRALVLGAGGGTVDTTGGDIGLAGVVSGTALTKAGTGTLVLSADNSYTGGTLVDRGTLAISAASVAGADAGSGTLTVGNQTLDLRHGAVLAADLALDGGTLANSAGSGRLDGALSIRGASTLSSIGSGLAVNGVISEAAASTGLTTQGPVTLTAASTYTGTTTIVGGALTLSGAAARPGSGAIAVGANRLVLDDGASIANLVRIGAGGSLANTAGSGEVAAGGAVQLAGNALLQVTGGGLTLAGLVSEASGAPASAVTIGGGGSVTLLAANSWRGGTTVEAGSLVLRGSAAAIGSGSLALGAHVLDLADGASLPNALQVTTGATLRNSSGTGALAAAGGDIALTGGATLHLDSAGAGLLVDRAFNDAGSQASLDITGATGQVSLAQANTLGGTVRVSGGGTAVLGAAGALGTAALQLDDGRLRIGSVAVSQIANATTLGSGGGTVDTGALAVGFSGVISGAGSLVKQGSGTLVLLANNGYSGTTTVADGVLAISGAGADAGSGRIDVGSQVLDLRNGASPAQAVVLGAGGVLRNSAGSGSIAATGSLRLDGDARLDVTDTGMGLAVLGAISESVRAALTTSGVTSSSAVTLAAANTYSGGTTVAGGTLRIDTAQGSAGTGAIAVGSGTLDISNGALVPNAVTTAGGAVRNSAGNGTLAGTLTMTGGATLGSTGAVLLVAGEVSGSGGLVSDAGSVTLSHVGNRFDGGLRITGGSLQLAGGDAAPDSATVTLAGSGRLLLAADETIGALAGSAATGVDLGAHLLTLGGSGASTRYDGVIDGAGSLLKTGDGSFTLAGANGYLGSTTVQQGTLALDSADERLADASRLVVRGGSVDLGGRRETVAAVLLDGGSIANGTLVSASNIDLRAGTVGAALAGTTAAVGADKTGEGLVTLAGINTYTGTTTLGAGTLALAGGGRLAALSRLAVDGGTLDLQAGTESVAGVRQTGGSIVNGTLVSASNFDLRAGSVSASLGGSSATVGLDKDGDGQLTLSGANTTLGDTTLRAGRLVLAGAADVLNDAGTLRVAGGTLDIGSHGETVGLLSLQGGTVTGTVTGSVGVLRSAQAFDLQAGTVDAILGGSAGAIKQGTGTVTLSAPNQYTGLTRVDAGTLVLAGAQRLAAAGTAQVASGATLTLNGEQALAGLVLAGSLNGAGPLSVPGVELDGGQLGVPLVVTSLGSSGSSHIAADTRAGTLTVRSGNLQLAAPDLLADSVQLAVEPGATLTLAGNETITTLQLRGTLTGPGTLSAGLVALDGGRAFSALGAGALTSVGTSLLDAPAALGTIDVQAGVFTTGTLARLDALPAVTVAGGARWALQGAQRIGSLAGAGEVDLAAHALRTGAGGDSRFDGVIEGEGSLVKQGDSRFTLAGGNTYRGDTVVEAGTLALAGADRLADATHVRVASGATLALDATDTVAELQLAGTLAGAGRLTAARYLLQAGRTEAGLGTGALLSSGNSTVAGAALVDSIDVADGQLTLALPAQLTSAPATRLAAGSTLALLGDTTLGSLAGAGDVGLGAFTLTTGAGGDSRFDGVISGDGALQKLGGTRFTLAGSQRHTGGTTVRAGTLALDGADRLADAGTVTVARDAVLELAGDDRVASLQLQGTLAGRGTLSAATYTLDGGTVLADLGAGTLTSRGSSTLGGSAAAGTVEVQAGRLTLTAADRLADAAAVTVASGAVLTLNGPDRVASLLLAGTLDGSGTLSASRSTLQGGTVLADLGGGALDSRGDSRLVGQAAVDSLAVLDGRLSLASAGRLTAAPAAEVAAGARLVLGGDETLGRLAGAGDVAIGAFTLRTGGGGSSTFAGVIDGDGSLVKQGADTTFGLTGSNLYRGPTWVAEGTLAVGDGARSGAIDATREIRVDGTLQFNRADAVLLAQPVAGRGGITQAGSGTLSLSGINKTYTGPTVVRSGTLATSGDEALSDTSAVQVDAGARLQLGGAETIAALQADGPVSLGGRLSASGTLVFNGPATVAGGGPLLLQAAAVEAMNLGNSWGSRLSLDVGGRVQLSSGAATGSDLRPLTLGEVQVGTAGVASGDGRIEAASILLDGATRLRGGTLLLDLRGGAVLVEPGAELLGRLTPANRQIAFTDDLLRQTPATATSALALEVETGARLDVAVGSGGSVALLNPGNRIDGGLSVVLGQANSAWQPGLVRPVAGGTEYSLQSRLRLAGSTLRIGGVGIQADVVQLQADSLATDGQATILARLPYDNQAGTAVSMPGLSLVLRDPGAFADAGGATTTTFGSGSAPLRIDVGSTSFGGLSQGAINGGYVSLQPTTRLGGMGRTAVFLQGPATATGYSFFYDGARRQGTVPVFYNGESAVPPQVSGSISSTLSVSEGARKERFDEAVRTENVALRLRAGVIAEVGPGTPATVNTMSMEGLRPPSCTPAPGTLACAP